MFLIKSKIKKPHSRWWLGLGILTSRINLNIKLYKYLNSRLGDLQGGKNTRKIFIHNANPYIVEYNNVRINSDLYIKDFFFNKTLKKDFVVCLDIYNNLKVFPALNFYYPGLKLTPSNTGKTIETSGGEVIDLEPYLGLQLPLKSIPLNFNISYITNPITGKVLYAKAPGVKANRQKEQKKTKLIEVQLPSTEIKLFSVTTLCLFGISNSLNNKLVDGKFGSKNSIIRHINVRGVAKNPVDHPNGGRTKAKQPERSPWGWVAKKTK